MLQDRRIRFANSTFYRVLGYAAGELIEAPIETVIHPDERNRVLSRYERRLKGDIVPNFRFRFIPRDRSVRR